MNRRTALALSTLAGLAFTTPLATATQATWPTDGTTWETVEASPAVLPSGDLAVLARPVSSSPWSLMRLNALGTVTSSSPNVVGPAGGLASDTAGNVYAVSTNGSAYSRVIRISPAGAVSTVWEVTNPVDEFVGNEVLIDGRGRLLFAVTDDNLETTRLVRVNTDGSGAEVFQPTAPNNTLTPAVDQSGNAYAATWGGAGAPGRIWKITADGTMTQWVSLSNDRPNSLAVDGDGSLRVAFHGGSFSTVSPGGVETPVAGVAFGCTPSAGPSIIDAAGALYVRTFCTGSQTSILYRVSHDAVVTTLATLPVESATGIALDGMGTLSMAASRTQYPFSSSILRFSSGGSTPDIAPAPPAVPPAPTASAGERAATVSVAAPPANAQFGTPTSYEVSVAEDPAKACTISLPGTSCTITGLTGGMRYTFVAKARLLSWLTSASTASAAVVPTTATSPGSGSSSGNAAAFEPARLASTVKCSGTNCVTTGPLPPGATRVTQLASSGSRANAMSQADARRAVTGKCTLSPARVNGKKAKKRTFTCRIKLAKGTWTVATTAFRGSTRLAETSRRVTVKAGAAR